MMPQALTRAGAARTMAAHAAATPAHCMSQAELAYQEHAAAAPLRRFVRCLWTLQGRCELASPQQLLPDGCTNLVFNLGAPMQQVVDADTAIARTSVLVMGEVRRPVQMQSAGQVDLLGVCFWPGALRWFVDAPPAEIVDGIADESPLGGTLAGRLTRAAQDAAPPQRLPRLQAELLRRVAGVPQQASLVDAAVRTLLDHEGCLRIEALADTLAVSRRSLERGFSREVGLAPKQLADVLRFRRALRLAGTGSTRTPDWAALSLDCGYYDQSHLIRDFKRYTGQPPGVFHEHAGA